MSTSGQMLKYSRRVDVFRFAPNNGHGATTPPCPKSANFGSRLIEAGQKKSRQKGGFSHLNWCFYASDILKKARRFVARRALLNYFPGGV
jgi:hypothetical protein